HAEIVEFVGDGTRDLGGVGEMPYQELLVDVAIEDLQRDDHIAVFLHVTADLAHEIDEIALGVVAFFIARVLARADAEELRAQLIGLIDAALDNAENALTFGRIESMRIELHRE